MEYLDSALDMIPQGISPRGGLYNLKTINTFDNSMVIWFLLISDYYYLDLIMIPQGVSHEVAYIFLK